MYGVVRDSKTKFEILRCGMISCQYGKQLVHKLPRYVISTDLAVFDDL